MNATRKNANQASVNIVSTGRFTKSLAAFALAGFAVSATLANATDIVLMASGSTSAIAKAATPEQALATINVNAGYDATTRNGLVAVARYPNHPDARNQQLQGQVVVGFEIDRQGVLQDATVSKSSHWTLLDKAALSSVRWAKYQPFPTDFVPGENSRHYVVMFNYRFDAEAK